MQEIARIAEIPTVDPVTDNVGSDFAGLVNALGEAAAPEVAPAEVAPAESVPQQFSIATPRVTGKGRGNKNTIGGALAAMAVAKKGPAPENVDAGIAPKASKKARLLAIGDKERALAIEDGAPPKEQIKRAAKQKTLNDVGFSGKAPKVINKFEQKEKGIASANWFKSRMMARL